MFYHPSRGRNIKIGEVDAAIAGASVDENNIVSLNIIIVKVIGSYTFFTGGINDYRLADEFVKGHHVYTVAFLQKVPRRINMSSSMRTKRDSGEIASPTK
jgi:hypothetical protein